MTEQRTLFDTPAFIAFDGETYDPLQDRARLESALGRVWDLMRDGKRRTLREIADSVGCSEAGASARLRDLRKAKFREQYPNIDVHHERLSGGLYEYWVVVPAKYRRRA